MNIKESLVKQMKDSPTVSAKLGARIFPHIADAGTAFPYLIYERLDAEHHHHQGGASGLVNALFQFTIWSECTVQLEDAAEAVRNLFDGFRGQMQTTPVPSMFLTSETDDKVSPTDNSETTKYLTVQDYTVWHRVSIPTLT